MTVGDDNLGTAEVNDARLLALAAAGRELSGVASLDELYPVAAELALTLLSASSASIARIERDHGLLRVLRNVGQLADWEQVEPADEVYDVADFPLLAATPEAAFPWYGSLDATQTGESHVELLQAMGMHSSISLPVIVGSTVWGEVGAARTAELPAFGPTDVATGEAFCGLLAASIARIEDRDELHALAYRDGLTGLGNRRAVDERLELLFGQPTLLRPVTVILADVDGLKTVNDEWGHDAGDRVLREVGSILTLTAGGYPGALAARLGGDEFCLVLEGTVSDDVEQLVAELVAAGRELPLNASLSCGSATARRRPGDAPTATAAARALLRLADAAQYRAKRAGRAAARVSTAVGGGASAGSESDQELGSRVVAAALDGLRTLGSAAPVDERLEVVGRACEELLDTCAWSVSVSLDAGPVTIVRNVDEARLGKGERVPLTPGIAYALDDYPATAAALAGGMFHATIDVGDHRERAFLAANGYEEIVGAGAVQDPRVSWLLEVCGDALSRPLAPHTPLLRSLVELAVRGGDPVKATAIDAALRGQRDGSSA